VAFSGDRIAESIRTIATSASLVVPPGAGGSQMGPILP
jgi:hypothetical protein